MWCTSLIPPTWEAAVGRSQSKAGPRLKWETISENNLSKKGCGVAHVIGHLPSKCKALSSNINTTEKVEHGEESMSDE
jgi:hypothetical protein